MTMANINTNEESDQFFIMNVSHVQFIEKTKLFTTTCNLRSIYLPVRYR